MIRSQSLAKIVLLMLAIPGFGGPVQAAVPKLTPPQFAQYLLASQNALSRDGHKIYRRMNCLTPFPQKEPGHMVCNILLLDPKRARGLAKLDIHLYDRDTAFAINDNDIAAHIKGLNQRYSMDTKPDVTLTDDKTGQKYVFQTACHQGLGNQNTQAYCGLQVSPRVFIMSGVSPATASVSGITMGGGSASDQDVDHANDVAIKGLLLIMDAK